MEIYKINDNNYNYSKLKVIEKEMGIGKGIAKRVRLTEIIFINNYINQKTFFVVVYICR